MNSDVLPSKTTIVAVSHAGANVGDNLLAEVLAAQLRRHFPEQRIDSFSIIPNRLHVPDLTSLYPGDARFPGHVLAYVRALRSARFLVGFWAIQDRGSTRFALTNLLPRYFFNMTLPGLLGVPRLFINVDAAALHTRVGRWLARRAMRRADLLVVRNETSRSVLRELDSREIPVTSDMGMLYTVPEDVLAQRGQGIVLNLRPVPGQEAALDSLIASLVPFLEELGRERVSYIAMRPEDLTVLDRLKAHFPLDPARVHFPSDPKVAAEIVGRGAAVIAMRLHVQVLALLCRRPVFTVAYHPKNLDIAAQVGAGDWTAPLEESERVHEILERFREGHRAGTLPVFDTTAAKLAAGRTFELLRAHCAGATVGP